MVLFCSKAVILIYDTKCNHGFLRVNSINYVIIKSRICIIKDSVVNISCNIYLRIQFITLMAKSKTIMKNEINNRYCLRLTEMKKICLPIVGTICFPEEFDQIFTVDGRFLITRNLETDWCFEMSGESMFYALCELERLNNVSLFDYKLKIIDAIDRRIDCVYEKIIHPLVFKFIFPTVFFNDGFIARDLSVLNRHVDYQLVNIVDFARLLNLYKKIGETRVFTTTVLSLDAIVDKLDQAISFVENNKLLLEYVISNDLQKAWYAEMYYTMSNINLKYKEKAQSLYSDQLYCSESPFYKLEFLDEKK